VNITMNTLILDEIEKLSAEEKIFLVEKIWNSIEDDYLVDNINEQHLEVIKKRLADYRSGSTSLKSWDAIKSKYGY
jgi:putative addiction module component (TIGR02574 family)